jgi:hypothetical protein
MTFRGPGYWLDWRTGQFDEVYRHDLWLCTPANGQRFGLPATTIDQLVGLHPFKDEDEIRMLGLKAGLVRMRDQGNYFACEFAAEPHEVGDLLRAVEQVLSQTEARPWELFLFNLATNEQANIDYDEFVRRLASKEPIIGDE